MRLKEFIVNVGMTTESAANSDTAECGLIYEIWRALRGEEKEEIQSEDLRVIMLCILRLYEHKRIGVDMTKEEKEKNQE